MPEFTADDGVRLHYATRGEGGLPILYLHWMGGDVSEWTALWNGLGDGQYRHVALDFRGHGQSEHAVSTFTNERLARDVLQLADTLALERFVVIGHSFGGKVAMRLAAMAPTRVAGLVLLGPVGPGKVPLEREAVEPILSRASDVAFVRDCFRPWFSIWPRPELDRWAEAFVRTPVASHRAVCEIALWTDIGPEVGQLATPAMVIAGEHDPVYGPAYQCEAVLPAIPLAKLVTANCGHGLVLERPDEIAEHCDGFLSGMSS